MEVEEYVVEDVLAHMDTSEGIKYYIKWEGYDSSNNTWEFESNMNCPELIKDYWTKRNLQQSPTKKRTVKNERPTRSRNATPPFLQGVDLRKVPVLTNYPDPQTEEELTNWEEHVERILSIQKVKQTTYAVVAWKNGYFSTVELTKAHEKLPQHVTKYIDVDITDSINSLFIIDAEVLFFEYHI